MAAETKSFGPYELVRELGRGGMAETFVAARTGAGGFSQAVCVKRILPELVRDTSFIDQFNAEARVSASLRHANIVGVLDFGVAEGLPYLALELVDGIDLHGLLSWLRAQKQLLTPGLVVYLAGELASALDFAHTRPGRAVVHRDISPSNVLISRAGEVKLSDFGIARVVRPDHVTNTMTIRGKVPYLSPESLSPGGGLDVRSDLFALGVTLFESLAGRRPFDGGHDLATLTRISTGQRTPLLEACPTAPAALVEIVERLLAHEPAHRFQTASELSDALVEIPPPPTSRKILGDLVRRAAAWRAEQSGAAPVVQPPAAETARAVEAPTAAVGGRVAPAAGSAEPASAAPGEVTRTRRASEPLQTERLAPRLDMPMTSDRARTRTALSPEVLAQLELESGATIREQESPGQSDPSLRAALEGRRGGDAVEAPVSRMPLYVGAAVAVGVLAGLAVAAWRVFG
jgi:eukaryotic-like serine/threonine-protein kinase